MKKIIYLNQKSIFKIDYIILRNFYKLCIEKSQFIFYDLQCYLKINLLWFFSLKHFKQQSYVQILILNEMEEKFVLDIKEKVLNGNFKWGVPILFSFTKKEIFFTDKLVEEVLRILIEPIFEVNFVVNSFGFRPYYTVHSAFNYIFSYMLNSMWVLNCNLQGWFDNLSLIFFFNIFCLRVKDPFILSLFKLGFETKYWNSKYNLKSVLGIPVGGGLSSLLANIYLDAFDKWINNICLFNRGEIKFLRYGDSFLLGVIGSYGFACELKERINNFLQKQLFIPYVSISFDLEHITKGVMFLGYFWGTKLLMRSKFTTVSTTKYLQHSVLQINIRLIITILKNWNICDGSGKALPLFIYLHFSQKEANQRVNDILLFFCNWIQFAANRRYIMAFISGIFRFALAKMYAAKFKLKTTSVVWTKGGYFLNKPLSTYKTKNSIIPKILYTKYNLIPYQKKSSFVDLNLNLYNKNLKLDFLLTLIVNKKN